MDFNQGNMGDWQEFLRRNPNFNQMPAQPAMPPPQANMPVQGRARPNARGQQPQQPGFIPFPADSQEQEPAPTPVAFAPPQAAPRPSVQFSSPGTNPMPQLGFGTAAYGSAGTRWSPGMAVPAGFMISQDADNPQNNWLVPANPNNNPGNFDPFNRLGTRSNEQEQMIAAMGGSQGNLPTMQQFTQRMFGGNENYNPITPAQRMWAAQQHQSMTNQALMGPLSNLGMSNRNFEQARQLNEMMNRSAQTGIQQQLANATTQSTSVDRTRQEARMRHYDAAVQAGITGPELTRHMADWDRLNPVGMNANIPVRGSGGFIDSLIGLFTGGTNAPGGNANAAFPGNGDVPRFDIRTPEGRDQAMAALANEAIVNAGNGTRPLNSRGQPNLMGNAEFAPNSSQSNRDAAITAFVRNLQTSHPEMFNGSDIGRAAWPEFQAFIGRRFGPQAYQNWINNVSEIGVTGASSESGLEALQGLNRWSRDLGRGPGVTIQGSFMRQLLDNVGNIAGGWWGPTKPGARGTPLAPNIQFGQ